jgi:ribosomal protein S18 acetylase RimI-like enzyme
VKLRDWRLLPASRVSPLYERERDVWQRALSWDTTGSWATVEAARVSWGLPGFVCLDACGDVRGWTFFIIRHQCVEVGAIVADDLVATEMLVEGLVDQASETDGIRGFVYEQAVGLRNVLARHGVTSSPFLYLLGRSHGQATESIDEVVSLSLLHRLPARVEVRPWAHRDADETARLLRDAYGASGALFSPSNTHAEWREYVSTLVEQTGCGVLSAELSRAVTIGGRLQAIALVTMLGTGTAHLAQLAVDPGLRRNGVARALAADVFTAAARAGYVRISLLVASENDAARSLYRSLRLGERGRFLTLRTDAQPRRFTSVALASGGVTTRR